MFKILQHIFGKKDLLQQSLEESWTMLQIDKEMFDASIKSLRELDSAEIEIDMYETDRKINRLERDVRKKVLTHLAVSGSANLSTGLTLVSIISDIERIGDYTKNIYELASVHPQRLDAGKWEDDLKKIETTVAERLGNLKEALKNSDTDMGKEIIKDMRQAKKKCDEYVLLLIKGEGEISATGQAVSLVLYMRYLKRIASHIQNVTSSIINPFHRIKYVKKKSKHKG